MKRRHALSSLAAMAGGLAAAPAARAAPAQPGMPVAWPEVNLLDGQTFGAKQAAGHAVVAVFWSTTCPFCRRHNQHLDKLHRAAAGKSLRVITVARDRDPALVHQYMKTHGYSFPVSMAYAPMAAALSTRNMIPLTITVDRQGRLVQVLPGEMFEEDVLDLLKLAG